MRRANQIVAALVVTITATATADMAAAELPITPGERVRLLLARAADPVVGTVVAVRPDELEVSVGVRTHLFPVRDIVRLDVSQGRKEQRVKWALIGVTPWVAIVALTLASGGVDESGIVSPQSAVVLIGGFVGGLVVGSHKSNERWLPVSPPVPRTSSHGGLAVGVTLRF